jgi:hypothetical protein
MADMTAVRATLTKIPDGYSVTVLIREIGRSRLLIDKLRPPQRRSRPNTRFLGTRLRCFIGNSVHCLRPTLSPSSLSRGRCFRLSRLVDLDREQHALLPLIPLCPQPCAFVGLVQEA